LINLYIKPTYVINLVKDYIKPCKFYGFGGMYTIFDSLLPPRLIADNSGFGGIRADIGAKKRFLSKGEE
jgi:hypothetical protein